MKPFVLWAVLALLCPVALPAAPEVASESLPVDNSSLVRVNSTNQPYDFFRPWMKKAPYMRRGLGVVLADRHILVTAELVANHTYIELEKADSAEKTQAEVVVVDYECNLALLRPMNPEFLAKARPLKLDSGARVGDRALILQLESNGLIAQTPATITTITVTNYPMDRLSLLTYRLSAPLQNREGSFTIPAVRDGRLLGLLMRYDGRSQTADVIPAPVIAHFLKDAKLDKYPGFPRVGVSFASTRDPQFRRYIGLRESGGVYVTEVAPGGPGEKAGLRRGDIILSVAGKPVDQDGLYDNPDYGKISFSYLTSTAAHSGDTVEFVVLRDGKRETIPVTLTPLDRSRIVSEPYIFDRQPRYFILGGLVFQELSRTYLQEWGGSWRKDAPQRLVFLDTFQGDGEKFNGKVVFLSQVLPAPNNLGYQNLDHLVVRKVNGVEINSLDDLARAAAAPVDGFHKIEFEGDPTFIYLDAEETERSKKQLMEDYNIPSLQNLN
jgi:Trypsin-like serine proteases, typically periplasmic, contain C-terminal PDZ domain